MVHQNIDFQVSNILDPVVDESLSDLNLSYIFFCKSVCEIDVDAASKLSLIHI